jgi:tuberous sclerosis protein 2
MLLCVQNEVADVKTAITGLVKIFTTKMYQLPSGHSVKAYKLLVNHLEAHYQKPAVFEMTSSIRYMVSRIELIFYLPNSKSYPEICNFPHIWHSGCQSDCVP